MHTINVIILLLLSDICLNYIIKTIDFQPYIWYNYRKNIGGTFREEMELFYLK